MKVKKCLVLLCLAMVMLAACGSKDAADDVQNQATVTPEPTATQEPTATSTPTPSPTPQAASAVSLKKQGNPTKIYLAEIAEGKGDDCKAWIKVSTAFDPTLSVYSCDLIPENTEGFVVNFKVKDMDCGEQTMYWCYQFKTASGTVSLWNDTSAADKLTITGDGTYQFVFDAIKAIGEPIVQVESFQMVFPGLSEDTTTIIELTGAQAVTDAADLAFFTTGKVEQQ